VAQLEAGQKLGSEMLPASTATLVPGCGNRIIVPSEKKTKKRLHQDFKIGEDNAMSIFININKNRKRKRIDPGKLSLNLRPPLLEGATVQSEFLAENSFRLALAPVC